MNIEQYKAKIIEFRKLIRKLKGQKNNIDEYLKLLKELYFYLNEVALKIYNETGTIDYKMRVLLAYASDCENIMPRRYILNPETNFKSNILPASKILDSSYEEVILNTLVYMTRNYLLKDVLNYKYGTDFSNANVDNCCPEASAYVDIECKLAGLEEERIIIEPGFNFDYHLYGSGGFHYFNIVKVNNKPYLIDCTYKQFFRLEYNILERIGVVETAGCQPGIFMLMNEFRKKVAKKILQDGWIELTPSVLKAYLDGFAISFRNGLYYEETNDFSYNTNYTYEDYVNFLSGNDNQVNHENLLYLGFPTRPLKNPHLSFTQTK